MGRLAAAIKQTIRLGGTGIPYSTPLGADIVYTSPWETSSTVEGISVTFDKALTYIPFFAAVRLISEDVASLPLGVYQDLEERGRRQDKAHPLQGVLHDQANPYMTSFALREVLQSHCLTWGNGFAEIEYATDGSVMALWPLRPDRMQVLLDTDTNRLFYRYRLTDGKQVDLPRNRVFHLHGLGFDGLVGYSVVHKAAVALAEALEGSKHSAKTMQRGNIPPAVLKHPGTLGEQARINLRESWDAIDHRNRVAILEEGLDLQTIGMNADDAQFVQTMGLNRSLMATLFRLPPHMLSDVERSTSWGTGIEQQAIGYVKHTLRPWLVRWEQQIKMQLLMGEDRYARHNVDGLLRGDSAARWTAYKDGLLNGVLTINEVREMEDRNPISDGDRHFVPLNMAPLDQVGEMSMEQRLMLLTKLTGFGFQPEAAAEAVEVEPIEHTGLEPVTVSEQGDYIGGNGNEPSAVPE